MKKLIIISSALIAFSAVNLFANEPSNNSYAQAVSAYNTAGLDTVPTKKDTTKKKMDTTSFQLKERK